MAGLKLGKLVIEGKTKQVYELTDEPGNVLVRSKDKITAGDGARAHDLAGKAVISNKTNGKVFQLLSESGIKTHFVRPHSDTEFIGRKCHMVPIEWVTRRLATGSFLRRHPGVPEGYRFAPPKQETFFKDDANHDPQWSEEQLVSAKLQAGPVTIGKKETEIMSQTTVTVFEILEKIWTSLGCQLVDMKVEYGVDSETGEILLADVIDSDSWRLWPSGDKRLMKDKQVYRNLVEVTAEALEQVKKNFAWSLDKLNEFKLDPSGRVVVLMGAASDLPHCNKIKKELEDLKIPVYLRVTSAHKTTTDTLKTVAEFESDGIPTVFIGVAGRSNGLGPVTSANTTYPVINSPPITADWAAEDVWSSLRVPSGLGCPTVLLPETAALHAAQILATNDPMTWNRLRAKQLNTRISIFHANSKVNSGN